MLETKGPNFVPIFQSSLSAIHLARPTRANRIHTWWSKLLQSGPKIWFWCRKCKSKGPNFEFKLSSL